MHLSSAQHSQPAVVGAARLNGASVRPANGAATSQPPVLCEPGIDWTAWRQHVAGRQSPVALKKFFVGRAPALGWGLDALPDQFGEQDRDFVSLANKAERGEAAALARLRSLVPQGSTGDAAIVDQPRSAIAQAIGRLAFARALPALSRVVEAEAWFVLLNQLIQSSAPSNGHDATVLTAQLLHGELPLTLAYLFPELPDGASLLTRGWQAVERALDRYVNEEGTLPDVELACWPALAASWTRSRMMGENAGCASLSASSAARYQQLLGHLWRLRRPRGGYAFSPDAPTTTQAADDSFWRAARCYAAAGQRALIRTELKDGSPAGKAGRPASRSLASAPAPAMESEAAGLAILRPSWATSDRLVVDYRGGDLRCELVAGGDVLLSGACGLALSLDGVSLTQEAAWEQVCWVSDDDADYLELQLSFSHEVRVQRHLLLAREDRFLFWADAVLGSTPGMLDYHCMLPLADGIAFQPAADTREGYLTGRRRRAAVLPLALAEWREEPSAGRLAAGQRGLELSQMATRARALFAPLWIDLHPRRLARAVTWRRLTVVEDRSIQPSDVAAGYRVAVGREQWLFYRSLDACGNRTVLGHNLITEFFAGRFGREGVAEPLMEIEAANDGSATP